MTTFRLAVITLAIFIVSTAWAAPKVEQGNEPVKGMKTLIQGGYSKCGFCTVMEPTIEYLDKQFKDKLAVRYVDVLKDVAFRQKYGIDSAPVQLLFDDKGKLVMTHVGFCTKDELLEMLKEHGIQ